MKLLERAILGIIRKPTKSIIILLTSLIVMSILSSFFNVYHSIQSLTNEMNQMIQPTVMIERPTSSIKIGEDNYVTIDEKSRELYFELKKAYNEIEQLEEVNYSDIGVKSTLFLEGMEDYAVNHNISLDDYKYFNILNYFIIIFNLIPIYPLDGSKILSCFFYKITTFKISILLTLITSYILLFFLSIILFDKNKIIFLLYIFLYKEVNILYSNKNLIFNKFLLERYLNNFNFKKEKIIKSVDKMKKDYKHLFYFENKYMTESTFLKKMFDINKNL